VRRRDVLKTLAAGAAGSITTILLSDRSFGAVLSHWEDISLRCLGDRPGPRYLDGRTHDGTVGLAPKTGTAFTGTQWKVYRSSQGGLWLECRGHIDGPRWLDGRTHNGTVGLAPTNKQPYTGTRWKVILLDDSNPNKVIVALQCLGQLEGPRRWLDGRTHDGTVWLAPTTDAPFTGTRWEISKYPGIIDRE
jgi:hypothetical protein